MPRPKNVNLNIPPAQAVSLERLEKKHDSAVMNDDEPGNALTEPYVPTHINLGPGYEEERIEIYKLVAEGYTVDETFAVLKHTCKSRSQISRNAIIQALGHPEARVFIAKFRNDFVTSLKNIPLADKKARLHDLERLRSRAMNYFITLNPEKSKVQHRYFNDILRRLLEIIDIARMEMDQKPNLSVGININKGEEGELTDEQLKAERAAIIRRAQRYTDSTAAQIDEDSEGDGGSNTSESTQIFLAPSEELRRDAVSERGDDISDVRQQEARDQGLPAV